MKLREYQDLCKLFDEELDQTTQVAMIISYLYDFTLDEISAMGELKFIKYSNRVSRKLHSISKKPLINKIKMVTDAKMITLGQFIEVEHFLKIGKNESLHLIGASIWNDKRDHKHKADILLSTDVKYVLHQVSKFIESFNDLLNSYKGLFESDIEEIEEEEMQVSKADKPHPFIDQYGWIYSATQIADHERISLDEAFNLPILQAFNDLSYLKSYQSYQRKMNK